MGPAAQMRAGVTSPCILCPAEEAVSRALAPPYALCCKHNLSNYTEQKTSHATQ